MTVSYEDARAEVEAMLDDCLDVDDKARVRSTTLRALLAGPPEPSEPVAWREVNPETGNWVTWMTPDRPTPRAQPLYTSPVPATEPTEEEVARVIDPAAMKIAHFNGNVRAKEAIRKAQAVQQLFRSRRNG